VTLFNPALQNEMTKAVGTMGGAATAGATSPVAMAMVNGRIARQASALSFLDLFHLLGLLFLAVVPVVWAMRRPRHQRGGAAAH